VPAAILLTEDGAKVLQAAPSAAATGRAGVSIDTIAYSATGEVMLSGRGAAEDRVRLYLDNRVLLEIAVAADGTWGGTLPAVAAGVYTLRADQLSAQGRVTSRYETPFQREDPGALQSQPATLAPPGEVSVTVQPGFTLWRIARETYGDGFQYVVVYDANDHLIKDPDLIYPGQVFALPRIGVPGD
jgi:nucleoid-associated protein YgaU